MPPWDPDTTDPQTGAPLPVHKTFNVTDAQRADPRFHRANLWGVTVPGLPEIPGGATGPAAERALSYLFDLYPAEWQAAILQANRSRGYRHFWLSIPDSCSRVSHEAYLGMARQVKAAGLIPCHFLRSKDFPAVSGLYDLCDQLNAEGLFTHAIPAWEASIFFSPSEYQAVYTADATRYPDTLWGHHFQQGYAHFSQDRRPPAEFWEASIAVGIRRLYYQYVSWPADQAWTGGMMQARTNDCLTRLVQGGLWGLSQTVEFVPFELVGMQLFYNLPDGDGRMPPADENSADLKGLECLCSPGPQILMGFGNGARFKDGGVI